MFNLRWQSRNDSFFKGKSTLNCGFISKLKVQQNKMAHMCEENNSVLIQSLRERMLKEKHPTKEKQLGKILASNCNFCFQNSYSPPPPPPPPKIMDEFNSKPAQYCISKIFELTKSCIKAISKWM